MNRLLPKFCRLVEGFDKSLRFSRVWIWVLAVLINLIWASTFASTEILLRTFSPFEIQIVRFLIAWAVLWVLRPKLAGVRSFRDHLTLACMGGIGVALYQVLENRSVSCLHSTSAGVIMSLGPLISVTVLGVMGRTRLSRPFVFGGLVAAGASVVSCVGDVSLLRFPLPGVIMSVCAMLCWCVYVVGSDCLLAKGYESVVVVRGAFFWSVLLSVAVLAVVCLVKDMMGCCETPCPAAAIGTLLSRVRGQDSVGHFVLLGVGASALCYVLWCRIGATVGFGRATILLYLSPALVVIADMVFFGKHVACREVAGAFFAVAGVILAMKARMPGGASAKGTTVW